jgi:hypothetical protein
MKTDMYIIRSVNFPLAERQFLMHDKELQTGRESRWTVSEVSDLKQEAQTNIEPDEKL